jgi:hypothetical protein
MSNKMSNKKMLAFYEKQSPRAFVPCLPSIDEPRPRAPAWLMGVELRKRGPGGGTLHGPRQVSP